MPALAAGLCLGAGFLDTRALAAASVTLLRGPYLQSGSTSNIIVQWRTLEPVESRARFGLTVADLPWEVSEPTPKTNHAVLLTNLAPNSRYFYTVGTSDTNLVGGGDCRFTTAPVQGKPTRIWAIGDSGTASQPGYEGKAAQVRDAYYAYTGARDTDVWLTLGDNAYLNGSDLQYQTELFDIYPTLLRRTVLWACLGNHDVVRVGAYPYMDIFSLPANGAAGGVRSGTEHYYSFNYGNIHFVCLDSEDTTDRTVTGPMLTWLQQDLDANTNQWLIAYWHSPPYTKGPHDSDTYDLTGEMIAFRQNAVPILEAHGVDLVLGAHSHQYERSYLLDGHYGYSWTLLPSMVKDSGDGRPGGTGPYLKAGLGLTPHQGAVYVVAGSSGWVTPNYITVTNQHPAMYITNRMLGSLVIDVDSNRLDAVFVRETGAIADSFTIIKGAAPEGLRIARMELRSGLLKLQWKSLAALTYRVESAPVLGDPSAWQPASPDIIAGGATTAWTNSVGLASEPRFYRVRKLP